MLGKPIHLNGSPVHECIDFCDNQTENCWWFFCCYLSMACGAVIVIPGRGSPVNQDKAVLSWFYGVQVVKVCSGHLMGVCK